MLKSPRASTFLERDDGLVEPRLFVLDSLDIGLDLGREEPRLLLLDFDPGRELSQSFFGVLIFSPFLVDDDCIF